MTLYRTSRLLLLAVIFCCVACPDSLVAKQKRPERKATTQPAAESQVPSPEAVRLNLRESKPETAAINAFLQSLMVQPVAEDVTFELTDGGVLWRVRW